MGLARQILLVISTNLRKGLIYQALVVWHFKTILKAIKVNNWIASHAEERLRGRLTTGVSSLAILDMISILLN